MIGPDHIQFVKMHGLGNDFIIVDQRALEHPINLSSENIQKLCDRRLGIGCDQLVLLKAPQNTSADIALELFNADGSKTKVCGNAFRCVAWLIATEQNKSHVTLAIDDHEIECQVDVAKMQATVDMGRVSFLWQDIPLSKAVDTNSIQEIELGPLKYPSAVSIGNPHMVFHGIDNVDQIDLNSLGPQLEHHPLFPERANLSIVQKIDEQRLKVRVWERGAGLTKACGTAACAALVTSARRGLCDRMAFIEMPGGVLHVTWLKDDHVILKGSVALAFKGTFNLNDFKN